MGEIITLLLLVVLVLYVGAVLGEWLPRLQRAYNDWVKPDWDE